MDISQLPVNSVSFLILVCIRMKIDDQGGMYINGRQIRSGGLTLKEFCYDGEISTIAFRYVLISLLVNLKKK